MGSLVCKGTVVGLFVGFGTFVSGCSDEAVGHRGRSSPPASPQADSSAYALKVWVDDGKSPARLVNIAPAGAVGSFGADRSETSAEDIQKDGAPGAPGQRPQATIGVGESESIDTVSADRAGGLADGWTLTKWAIKSCLPDPDPDTHYIEGTPFFGAEFAVSGAPWLRQEGNANLDSFYFFHFYEQNTFDATRNCDNALFLQETLLCAADRLAQVADSPGTVVWSVPQIGAGSMGGPAETAITVKIPPQAANDAFIAREMAFNVLAHLNYLDSRPVVGGESLRGGSCGDHFADRARWGGAPTPDGVTRVYFGIESTYFDPTPIDFDVATHEVIKEAAFRRLKRKSMVLASAARLTNRLIESSIDQDIAGAQQFLTSGGTSQPSARRAWGVEEGQSPANTLRHAVKTLFGRLEIGNHRDPVVESVQEPIFEGESEFLWNPREEMRDDPRCDGFVYEGEEGDGYVAGDGLLNMRGGTDARWGDVPPSSAEESRALQLLDGAGIVLPPSLDLADDVLSGAGSIISNELVRHAAMRAKPDEITDAEEVEDFVSDYRTSELGLSLKSAFDAIEPASWRFASARAYGAFRLLAHVPPITETEPADVRQKLVNQATGAGVPYLPSATSPSISDAGGLVVVGGLHRDELGGDVMAKFGHVQRSANCSAHVATGEPPSPNDPFWGNRPLASRGNAVLGFQNSFMLGLSLERHLADLARSAREHSEYVATLSPVADFAEAAAAETREWAGPGLMIGSQETKTAQDQSDLPNRFSVLEFANVALSDLGVETLDELVERLVLYQGPVLGGDILEGSGWFAPDSIVADCLAGVRGLCPEAEASDLDRAIVEAKYIQVRVPGVREGGGLHEDIYRVKFDEQVFAGAHVVVRAKNGRPGQVLGYLPYSNEDVDRFVEPISRRQRELANRVLGLRKINDIQRTCSDIAPLSLPSEYCIAGMDRDEFVPLANSLTSSGSATEDSFKHYLDVAEQSAARADELGRQLIDQGIQRDLRSEAAAEEVAQICGTYPNDPSVANFSTGEATPDPQDPALQACVSPEKYDVVFLRSDLAAQHDPDELCAAFCQVAVDPAKPSQKVDLAPFCSKKCSEGELVEGETITTAGLNLVTDVPPRLPTIEACEPVSNILDGDGDPDPAQLEAAIENGSISANALSVALTGLRLEELENGQWLLLSNGAPIMGTEDAVGDKLAALGLSNDVTDVWPLCDDSCSDRASLLKSVFPVPQGDDTTRFPGLRKAVERAVFFMGAMAGQIPPGVFSVPLPVVDRGRVSLDIPAPGFYAPARFVEIGTSGRYRPDPEGYLGVADGYPAAADAAMPTVHELDEDYIDFFNDRAETRIDWRAELFDKAAQWRNVWDDGVLMTDPIDSALIHFDPVLDPSDATTTRDKLPSWLRRVIQRYESGSLRPADVQQATFYRATDQDGDPRKFCPKKGQDGEITSTGQDLTHGRQVCTNAPVSPIFYATTPVFDDDDENDHSYVKDSCIGPGLPGHIFSTHRARTTDKGFYVHDPETGLVTDMGEVGWFRLFPAVGSARSDGCQVDGSDECRDPEEDGFAWSAISAPQCADQKLWNVGVNVSGAACEHRNIKTGETYGIGSTMMIPHDRLRPDLCGPAERVELFIETDVVDVEADKTDPRHAVEVLVRALTLGCATSRTPVDPGRPPPPIRTVEDMAYLEAWTASYAASVWHSASLFYLVDVPKAAVDVFNRGGANVNAVTQGDQGQALLELEKNLRLIESSISSLGIALGDLSQAIAEARLEIRGIQLEAKGQQLEIQLARVEVARQKALAEAQRARERIMTAITTAVAIVGGIAACGATAGAGCVAAAAFFAVASADNVPVFMDFVGIHSSYDININAANQSQGYLDEQAANTTELKNNRIQQALLAMGQRLEGGFERTEANLTSLGNSVSDALQNIGQFNQTQSTAAIALAKAAGSDFVALAGQDEAIPLHVNTVYRRQFDVTLQRYQRALASAKRAAYMARLAVEERLGVRMDELTESIGPLEAPALWADNLCTVQGVDYNALREAVPADQEDRDEVEVDLIRGFANQYVGDYVAQLREFVEFYNQQFPFAESNDVALVSMRSDVQDPTQRCQAPSPNLLVHSDRLDMKASETVLGPNPAYGGWSMTGCDQTYCSEAATGARLPATSASDSPPLAPPTPGHVSWLHSRLRSLEMVTQNDEGGAVTTPLEPPLVGKPSGYVFQTVDLEGGREYMLSWWDQGRAADGTPLTGALPSDLRVAVFDEAWNVVALQAYAPTASWSARRTLSVLAYATGPYHIAFSPASPGESSSVAIANVQLEETEQAAGGTSEYVSNAASRMHFTAECQTSAAMFSQRFDHRCGADGCWYVMRDPLIIDTEALNQGGSNLVGKVGQGNFNHRLSGVALNLVGTGLRDCTGQDTSCYGTGYVEYDLQHAAFNVPIEDFNNKVRCFDFGQGAIRSAKALASERFLTLPLSSSDKDLVSTPPFLKSELAGRPLSGVYKLRIKDSPGLVWTALEDVQLLINYNYWSKVDTAPAL